MTGNHPHLQTHAEMNIKFILVFHTFTKSYQLIITEMTIISTFKTNFPFKKANELLSSPMMVISVNRKHTQMLAYLHSQLICT